VDFRIEDLRLSNFWGFAVRAIGGFEIFDSRLSNFWFCGAGDRAATTETGFLNPNMSFQQ
jgi:hypothetical protein